MRYVRFGRTALVGAVAAAALVGLGCRSGTDGARDTADDARGMQRSEDPSYAPGAAGSPGSGEIDVGARAAPNPSQGGPAVGNPGVPAQGGGGQQR